MLSEASCAPASKEDGGLFSIDWVWLLSHRVQFLGLGLEVIGIGFLFFVGVLNHADSTEGSLVFWIDGRRRRRLRLVLFWLGLTVLVGGNVLQLCTPGEWLLRYDVTQAIERSRGQR